MTEPNFMSWDVFDRDGTEIETAVRLLLLDPKRRRRFQLGAVYEKRTTELLAEVLSTSFGPVVVYWAQVGAWANSKPRPSGVGVPLHMRQHRKSRPVAPLTGEADQLFRVMSRSNTSYELRGVDLIRAITEGVDLPQAALTFKGLTRL